MIGVTSFKLARLPHLHAFLDASACRLVTPWTLRKTSQIVGWGLKPSGLRAVWLSGMCNSPHLLLEDGFLRSLHPDDPPLSITVERITTHHDLTRLGHLDQLLQRPLTATQRTRARNLIEAWKAAGVSKYNHLPEYDGPLPERYVLVVDQLRGDDSVQLGKADETSFRAMLGAALEENPSATVVVKAHPLAAGRRKGYLNAADYADNPRILFITKPCSPVKLMGGASHVNLKFGSLFSGRSA